MKEDEGLFAGGACRASPHARSSCIVGQVAWVAAGAIASAVASVIACAMACASSGPMVIVVYDGGDDATTSSLRVRVTVLLTPVAIQRGSVWAVSFAGHVPFPTLAAVSKSTDMRMAEGRSTLARVWLPVHVFVSWMRTPFPYTGLPTLQDASWALLVRLWQCCQRLAAFPHTCFIGERLIRSSPWCVSCDLLRAETGDRWMSARVSPQVRRAGHP